jgi:hypothetical protein
LISITLFGGAMLELTYAYGHENPVIQANSIEQKNKMYGSEKKDLEVGEKAGSLGQKVLNDKSKRESTHFSFRRKTTDFNKSCDPLSQGQVTEGTSLTKNRGSKSLDKDNFKIQKKSLKDSSSKSFDLLPSTTEKVSKLDFLFTGKKNKSKSPSLSLYNSEGHLKNEEKSHSWSAYPTPSELKENEEIAFQDSKDERKRSESIVIARTFSDSSIEIRSKESDLAQFIKKEIKKIKNDFIVDPGFKHFKKEVRKIIDEVIERNQAWESPECKEQCEKEAKEEAVKHLGNSELLLSEIKQMLNYVKGALVHYPQLKINQIVFKLLAVKNPEDLLSILSNIKEQKFREKLIELIGGKKVFENLRNREALIERQVLKFFQKDLTKVVFNEISGMLTEEMKNIQKKFPTDASLCHLNTKINNEVKEHLSERSSWTVKGIQTLNFVYIQKEIALKIIKDDQFKPLLLAACIARLHEMQKALMKYKEDHRINKHTWIDSFNTVISDLLIQSSKKKVFLQSVSSIEDKNIKDWILKALGGEKAIFNLNNWKELVLDKVNVSVKLHLQILLLPSYYSIQWSEKKDDKEFIDKSHLTNITRSIFIEKIGSYNFNKLSIESVIFKNKMEIIKKEDTVRLEFFKDLISKMQACGWVFDEKDGTIEDQADKITQHERVSVSGVLLGATSIGLKSALFKKNKAEHYHQTIYSNPYQTNSKAATGGGIDCTIRISPNNQATILREWTDTTYICDAKYLTEAEKEELKLAEENELGRGYPVCETRKHFILTRNVDVDKYVHWSSEIRIARLTFLPGVSYQTQKEIIESYSDGIPALARHTYQKLLNISKPDLKSCLKEDSYDRSNTGTNSHRRDELESYTKTF